MALEPEAQREAQAELSNAGLAPIFLANVPALAASLSSIEYLLIGRPPRLDFAPAERLRLLQIAGSGVDPLFPARGLRDEVAIANCRGAHANGVRDHALSLLLAAARDLPRAFAQQARREWRPYASTPLQGQRLLLLGFGAVGSRVARAAAALGMRVSAVRRSARREPELERTYLPEELVEAARQADYLVICAPLTGKTRGLVDAGVIGALPRHAALIDVSRGGIVDHAALAAALQAGELRSAACDVFEEEPLPATSPLWSAPRLIVTPHVAGLEPRYFAPILASFAENVRRVQRGEAPLESVSRELEY